MDFPVTAQVCDHGLGNGDHAVLVALALAYPQLAALRIDVVDGEREAFRNPQAAAIDKFYRDAVTA